MDDSITEEFLKDGDILIVENNDGQFQGLKKLIEQAWPKWQVTRAKNYDFALSELEQRYMAKDPPHLVSVDLGLPPAPNSPDEGLRLLEEIREKWGDDLPLAVHSSLGLTEALTAEVLHKVMAARASYVALTNDNAYNAYAIVLPLMAAGCMFYSQQPASLVPKAIVKAPDPLGDDDWMLLREQHLHPEYTHAQIGKMEGINRVESAITAHYRRIFQRLQRKGFIEGPVPRGSVPGIYREPLRKFYKENHVRFGR